jgi:Ca2+-binding RTX toxin-like protein
LLVVGPLGARSRATVRITSHPLSETTETSATFTWEVTLVGAVPTVLCKLDSADEETCSSPKTYSGLALGSHRFVVRVRDRAGRDLGSDTYDWKIVSPPPPTTTTTATTAPTTTQTTPTPPKQPLPPLAHAIVGTNGNDVLRGTSGPDVIFGLGGNDTIRGLGGDDILVGGPGNDTLIGGAGNDTLIGGPGKDSFAGGPGNDRIYAVDGAADKRIDGGAGHNTAYYDPSDRKVVVGLHSFAKKFPVLSRPIIFSRNGWIYGMTAAGTSVKPIPEMPGPVNFWRADPVWSPDGTQIAFVQATGPVQHMESYGGSTSDIWVMNWDGSNAHAITNTPNTCEREPEWSPDGTRIAYYAVGCNNTNGPQRLEHKALDVNATPWLAEHTIGYTGISWRADGAAIYAGWCTSYGTYVQVDPWHTPPSSPSPDWDESQKQTQVITGYCAGHPTLSPVAPYRQLYTWYTNGFYESQNQSLPPAPAQGLRLKTGSSKDGELLIGFGSTTANWSNGINFNANWSGNGQHIVFSRGGQIWTMSKDGSKKKNLGVAGSDPDWR